MKYWNSADNTVAGSKPWYHNIITITITITGIYYNYDALPIVTVHHYNIIIILCNHDYGEDGAKDKQHPMS